MIKKSAKAKFVMNMFVTEFLIFLSVRTTHMTRKFPISPVNPTTQKRMESVTTAPVLAGGSPSEIFLLVSLVYPTSNIAFSEYVSTVLSSQVPSAILDTSICCQYTNVPFSRLNRSVIYWPWCITEMSANVIQVYHMRNCNYTDE